MNCLLSITVLLLTVSSFVCIQALECGIENSSRHKELKQIADGCVKKKVETENPKKTSSSSEESGESKEGSTEASKNIRNKRNDENSKTTGSNNATNKPESNNNNSTDNNNCIVHCIFTQLAMTDNNGYPEHHRVSQALLNNINNRELRDFIQDTTADCFQLMDQGEQQEPCQYSITLVSCLSERGKANCADWPVGNLSFLSNMKQN